MSTKMLVRAALERLKREPEGTVVKIDAKKFGRSPITIRQRFMWENNAEYKFPLRFEEEDGHIIKVWRGARLADLPDIQSAESSVMVTAKVNETLLAAYRVLLEEQVFLAIELLGHSPEDLETNYPQLMEYFTSAPTPNGTVLT